jgi:hypothetical protein
VLLLPELWRVYPKFWDHDAAIVELGSTGLQLGEGSQAIVEAALQEANGRLIGERESLFHLSGRTLSLILRDFNFYKEQLRESSNRTRVAEDLYKLTIEFLVKLGAVTVTVDGKVKLPQDIPKLEEALNQLNHFRIELHGFESSTTLPPDIYEQECEPGTETTNESVASTAPTEPKKARGRRGNPIIKIRQKIILELGSKFPQIDNEAVGAIAKALHENPDASQDDWMIKACEVWGIDPPSWLALLNDKSAKDDLKTFLQKEYGRAKREVVPMTLKTNSADSPS